MGTSKDNPQPREERLNHGSFGSGANAPTKCTCTSNKRKKKKKHK